MNSLSLPPLDFEAALWVLQTLEQTWNQSCADRAIELFSPDCEWFHLGVCQQGKQQVFSALQQYWRQRLHYRFKAQLWSHSFSRLAIRFQAEWQQATNGQWLQCQGCSLLQLDSDGRIRELHQAENSIVISSGERSLNRAR